MKYQHVTDEQLNQILARWKRDRQFHKFNDLYKIQALYAQHNHKISNRDLLERVENLAKRRIKLSKPSI